uniref:Uncharacterized protein n=1 Tax=viral metagenome TaxID=1070528 RepID=A0A6M3JJV8_9ZZZZ
MTRETLDAFEALGWRLAIARVADELLYQNLSASGVPSRWTIETSPIVRYLTTFELPNGEEITFEHH